MNYDISIIETKLSEKAKNVMKILEKENHDAYAVGGCIRDALLNVPCHDEDITTDALPEEVIEIFKKNGYNVLETGLKHGTVTVYPKGKKVDENDFIEITTFRSDGEYTDGRRPDQVFFEKDIMEDLKRRDFTINAMAYSLSKGFVCASSIDSNGIIHDGIQDLNDKIIRAVGNSDKRISEDYLRMMRGVRFAAKLGFDIDKDLFTSIQHNASNIHSVSKERINDELSKIIKSGNFDYFYTLHDIGLLQEILPELDACYQYDQLSPYHKHDLFTHIIESTKLVDTFNEQLAMLLHDIGKLQAVKYSSHLDFKEIKEKYKDNSDIMEVLKIFENQRTEENYLKFVNLLTDYEDKKMLYKTVERNGKTLISNNYYLHPEASANMAHNILKRLKFSNQQINEIVPLIKYHNFFISFEGKKDDILRKGIASFCVDNPNLATTDFFDKLIKFTIADKKTHGYEFDEKWYYHIKDIVYEMIDNAPHHKKDLAINGLDLKSIGYIGKEIEEQKNTLLFHVMIKNTPNNFEDLIKQSFNKILKEKPNLLQELDFNQFDDKTLKILLSARKINFETLAKNPTFNEGVIEKLYEHSNFLIVVHNNIDKLSDDFLNKYQVCLSENICKVNTDINVSELSDIYKLRRTLERIENKDILEWQNQQKMLRQKKIERQQRGL